MKRRTIRFKMWTVLVNLFLLVALLAATGLYAVRLHKDQVRDVTWRVNVLPVAGKLRDDVGELRTVLGELRGIRRGRLRISPLDTQDDRLALETKFRQLLFVVKQSYNEYQHLLEERVADVGVDDSFKQEFSTVHDIRRSVQALDSSVALKDWGSTDKTLDALDSHLIQLQKLANTLPNYLHEELRSYAQTMRRQARWLNTIVLVSVVTSTILMGLLIRLAYVWIFKPLGILIDGSRRVAAGTFQYRITLNSNDEMAELAESMNRMTERFEDIRKDLDRKVEQLEESRRDLDRKVHEKSRELVRSERLASVGFLAAGVAHEINNPLMAISTCAESLQRRILPLLEQGGQSDNDTEYAGRYLKMIQDEAFRCKGITEKLLSFARSEQRERQRTDLTALILDIVEMTRQHAAFKRKEIRLDLPESLPITANPQEMKQVVLNLLTNALGSTDADGIVTVALKCNENFAVLTVDDNGTGMDEATLKNIFEPFFTRRQQGQGTGLGLSITHRIVEEHLGRIEAFSDGPGRGARFTVELPLDPDDKNIS